MGEDSDPDGERESDPSDADETTPTGGKPDDGTAPPSDQDAESGASDREAASAGEDDGDDGDDVGDEPSDPSDAASESTSNDAEDDVDDDAEDDVDDDAEDDAEDDVDDDAEDDAEDDVDDDADDDADDDGDDGDDDGDDDADDDGDDGDDADQTEDEGPDPPSEEELEKARETAPPLDRDEALERKELRESEADEEDEADDEAPSVEQTATVDTDPYGVEEAKDADDELFEGPETDEEMPLADHIEEMMRRLGIVFFFGGIATLIAFPTATELINYFWSYHIPDPQLNRPRLYGPLELVLTRLKVASLAGVVVGLPVFVYQTYRFMKPGLYHNERRYYLAAVPTSLVLGSIGIMFAHFLVLPAIFSYFTAYTTGAAVIAFGLAETFNLIVVMLAFMAIVFQIPLFIMLAIMMNLVTRRWLEQKRLIFWGAFLGIAFIFSPDPTGMAPIIVTMTMIVLYEGTLALLRWTGN